MEAFATDSIRVVMCAKRNEPRCMACRCRRFSKGNGIVAQRYSFEVEAVSCESVNAPTKGIGKKVVRSGFWSHGLPLSARVYGRVSLL